MTVVGKFLGTQMTALAGKPPLALIDHLPDGEVGVEFSPRTLVITSDTNFTATADNLPDGLLFEASKALFYGIPTAQAAGVHVVTVTATASNSPVLVKHYPSSSPPCPTRHPTAPWTPRHHLPSAPTAAHFAARDPGLNSGRHPDLPKSQRFTLGQRLGGLTLDALLLVHRAAVMGENLDWHAREIAKGHGGPDQARPKIRAGAICRSG